MKSGDSFIETAWDDADTAGPATPIRRKWLFWVAVTVVLLLSLTGLVLLWILLWDLPLFRGLLSFNAWPLLMAYRSC